MVRVRVLSERELTLSYLDRQLLLRRHALGMVAAVRRLCALQAQYSPSPYVALFARLESVDQCAVEQRLRSGTLIKATLMRGTLHLVAAADYPTFAGAFRRGSREFWRRHYGRSLSPRAEAALVAGLAEFLATPRTADEIRSKVDELTAGAVPPEGRLHAANALLSVVHVPPSGFWRQHGSPSLTRWNGSRVPAEPAALAALVKRYLAAYGPAAREDIAVFTSLSMAQVDLGLAGVRTVRLCDPLGQDLFDLAGARIPDERTPIPVRFLPKWDSAILAHKDRRRILPEALRAAVIQRINGDVAATYLVDGRVAGIWSSAVKGDTATLALDPFVPLTGATQEALRHEGESLLSFMEPTAGSRVVTVRPSRD